MPKLTRIHANQHNIRSNATHGSDKPVITVKDYKDNRKGHTAVIYHWGVEVARVVYADGVDRLPLPCGARCWVETRKT